MTLAFWQAGNLAAAGRAVRDWARVDGSRPAAHRFAARIYEDMGAIDLAAEAAERATARAPGDAGEWERLGRLRLRLHDPAGAVDALRTARSLARASRGCSISRSPRRSAAISAARSPPARRRRALDPKSADAWSRLAHALARTDRIGDCLAACETAIKLGAHGRFSTCASASAPRASASFRLPDPSAPEPSVPPMRLIVARCEVAYAGRLAHGPADGRAPARAEGGRVDDGARRQRRLQAAELDDGADRDRRRG